MSNFDYLKGNEDNFHKDLIKLRERLKSNDAFAKDMYSALCNMQWQRKNNKEEVYSCTWRYAGGLIAQLRNKGETYLNYYCGGNEGIVSVEVENEMDKLGWKPLPY